ncbi:hypothetical protein quinque_009238 [Culex quinquefasciatus]
MAEDRVLPICLPYGEYLDAEKESATIAGWGHTENGPISTVLMHASVELRTNRYCANSTSSFNNTSTTSPSSGTIDCEKPTEIDIDTRIKKPLKTLVKELLDLEKCGKYSADRILHGQEAQLSQFPWMALLINSTDNVCCGGTLISERFVLTAAHYVKDVKIVRLGEHDILSQKDCDDDYEENCALPVQDFIVTKNDIIQHQYYSPSLKTNDIALIRLPSLADLTDDHVLPVCLPYGQFQDSRDIQEGANMTIAGWGHTEKGTLSNKLVFAPVVLSSLRQCSNEFNKIKTKINLDDRHICASGKHGQNHCVGDSGGPLQFPKVVEIINGSQISNQTVFVQHGIITFGDVTCETGSLPGVYTKVSYYIDWILYNMFK